MYRDLEIRSLHVFQEELMKRIKARFQGYHQYGCRSSSRASVATVDTESGEGEICTENSDSGEKAPIDRKLFSAPALLRAGENIGSAAEFHSPLVSSETTRDRISGETNVVVQILCCYDRSEGVESIII